MIGGPIGGKAGPPSDRFVTVQDSDIPRAAKISTTSPAAFKTFRSTGVIEWAAATRHSASTTCLPISGDGAGSRPLVRAVYWRVRGVSPEPQFRTDVPRVAGRVDTARPSLEPGHHGLQASISEP